MVKMLEHRYDKNVTEWYKSLKCVKNDSELCFKWIT